MRKCTGRQAEGKGKESERGGQWYCLEKHSAEPRWGMWAEALRGKVGTQWLVCVLDG